MEKELEGSQDSRIESLWSSLDEHGKGQIDVKALKKGLEKIDHRKPRRRFEEDILAKQSISTQECRRASPCSHQGRRWERRWGN